MVWNRSEMIYHGFKVAIRCVATASCQVSVTLKAQGYAGIERMLEGSREETKSFPKHGRFIRGQKRG